MPVALNQGSAAVAIVREGAAWTDDGAYEARWFKTKILGPKNFVEA